MISTFLKDEKGAVTIVEATFVFPIAFFVLFFLMFYGNAYYLKASVDSVVCQAAIDGAMQIQDPFLAYVNGEKQTENLKNEEITPYRYIFGNMDSIELSIEKEIEKSLNQSSGFFFGMKPKIKTNNAEFNNMVFYSTFVVEIDYTIQFPWRFLGSEKPTILSLSSRAEEPINDTPEFIRNTDMVLDMLDGNSTYQMICDKFDKVKEFINNFVGK